MILTIFYQKNLNIDSFRHFYDVGNVRAKRISKFFKEFSNTSAEQTESHPNICAKEFCNYKNEKVIDVEENPLNWWREKKSRFPNLWNVAKNYLATPASQASSERIFLVQGNTIYDKRKLLDPTIVEEMAFLHDNADLGNVIENSPVIPNILSMSFKIVRKCPKMSSN